MPKRTDDYGSIDGYDEFLPDVMASDREIQLSAMSAWGRKVSACAWWLLYRRIRCGACGLMLWRDRKKFRVLPRGISVTPICPHCNPIRGKTAGSVTEVR